MFEPALIAEDLTPGSSQTVLLETDWVRRWQVADHGVWGSGVIALRAWDRVTRLISGAVFADAELEVLRLDEDAVLELEAGFAAIATKAEFVVAGLLFDGPAGHEPSPTTNLGRDWEGLLTPPGTSSSTAVDGDDATGMVKDLLSQGRVEEARSLARTLGGDFERLLAPPVASPSAPCHGDEAGFRENDEWLTVHAHDAQFRNCWVALRDGELLGSNQSRIALHRDLKERGELKNTLFVRVV